MNDLKQNDLKQQQKANNKPLTLKQYDRKQFKEKLNGYKIVSYKDIQIKDHLRITQNLYKKKGRKCVYVVIKEILEDGKFKVNSYIEQYEDWTIDFKNKFKFIVAYKRILNNTYYDNEDDITADIEYYNNE